LAVLDTGLRKLLKDEDIKSLLVPRTRYDGARRCSMQGADVFGVAQERKIRIVFWMLKGENIDYSILATSHSVAFTN
jgi:hypothetical protein